MQRAERLGPRMVRVTFRGPELVGFAVDEPAASVRLLLPRPGAQELEMPSWNGNEFLLTDGTRPIIRTFTPRRTDAGAGVLDLDIVIHGGGAASRWADAAGAGDSVAVSGPGRGYTVDPEAGSFLLAGDETAIPAISQLLESLAPTVTVNVDIEVAHPDGRIPLPPHPGSTVQWHTLPANAPPGQALVGAVTQAAVGSDTTVWVAGEAAAVQRIRQHLFEERGLSRAQATVRGYWKAGRSGDTDDV